VGDDMELVRKTALVKNSAVLELKVDTSSGNNQNSTLVPA